MKYLLERSVEEVDSVEERNETIFNIVKDVIIVVYQLDSDVIKDYLLKRVVEEVDSVEEHNRIINRLMRLV